MTSNNLVFSLAAQRSWSRRIRSSNRSVRLSSKRCVRIHLRFIYIMAHFHQRRGTRIRIRIPNPIVTLYYAQLFPLVRFQIWIPVWIVSRMVTVPILGTDLHPRDPNPSPLVGMSHKSESDIAQDGFTENVIECLQ